MMRNHFLVIMKMSQANQSSPVHLVLNPTGEGQQDEFTETLRSDGYVGAKKLEDGSYACVMRLMFTVAICLGADRAGFERRFCFDDLFQCLDQYSKLRSKDDHLTGYIAKRPE